MEYYYHHALTTITVYERGAIAFNGLEPCTKTVRCRGLVPAYGAKVALGRRRSISLRAPFGTGALIMQNLMEDGTLQRDIKFFALNQWECAGASNGLPSGPCRIRE